MLRSLLDVATGMSYLHKLGIVHGDLKSANVLLKSTATDLRGYHCKIADFGCVLRVYNGYVCLPCKLNTATDIRGCYPRIAH